jgi:hypothetical protein
MRYRGVENGTPVGRKPLCDTCLFGLVRRGFAEGQHEIKCTAGSFVNDDHISFEVASCTRYLKRNEPDLSVLKEIAWEIKTKGNRFVGFVKPGSDEHSTKSVPGYPL